MHRTLQAIFAGILRELRFIRGVTSSHESWGDKLQDMQHTPRIRAGANTRAMRGGPQAHNTY